MTIDTFLCPECKAPRRGDTTGDYHAPACPRALGRSNLRGPDARALEGLGARLTPTTRVYVMRRSSTRTGKTDTIGLAVLEGGRAVRIAREVAAALGLEYDARDDGVLLRPNGAERLIVRLGAALFGPGAALAWEWL